MAQENNFRCAARTFEVLEILLLILSYLPPSQLRIGPTLVCKQWHVVCLLFITNTTTWDSRIVSKNSKEETVFNQRIKTTDILRCHIEDDRWGARDAIKSLTQSIASLSNNGQHHRIQKLDFTHRDDNPQGILVLNIFAPLSFLTSLRIRTQSIWTISLDRLLSVFSQLQELDLGFMEPRLPDRSSPSNLTREHQNRPWPDSTKALCSLTFESMTIDLSLLESLLSVCPMLKELKLIAIQQQYQQLPDTARDHQNEILPHFDGCKYFSAIARHCPRLKSFHFSEAHCPLSIANLQAIAKSFPNLSSWSMIASSVNSLPDSMVETTMDMHSRIGAPLQTQITFIAHQLTTLELVADDQASTQWPSEFSNLRFHQLLCITPNLLHLKAPRVCISTKYMDMNNWNGSRYYGFWSCRRLRTFHISLGNMYRDQDHERGNQRSRIFFAYLVHCCPKLQDIAINFSDLEMHLSSGVCLLSELEDLQHLIIESVRGNSITELDIWWLSTLDLQDRATCNLSLCKSVVRQMRTARDEDEQDSSLRCWNKDQEKWKNMRPGELDLWYAIWRASRPQGIADVLERVLEKQLRGGYCWNDLESLSLRHDCMHLIWKHRPGLRKHTRHRFSL